MPACRGRKNAFVDLLAPLKINFKGGVSVLNLSEKKDLVQLLNVRLSDTQIAILVDYKGLDVASISQLRDDLRKEGVKFKVVKNTLLSMASKGTDSELMVEFFSGPNAIVTCKDDPVAPARILVKFAESNNKLQIKAGAMSGKALSSDDIKALAKLPSREVLLSQLLSTMNEVPTALVRVLAEVPRSLLNVLNAIEDRKKAA